MTGDDTEKRWVEPPGPGHSVANAPGNGDGGALTLGCGGRIEAPAQCVQQVWILTGQGHSGENIVVALVKTVESESK